MGELTSMTTVAIARFSEIRYALRGLIDQVIGYGDVILQRDAGAAEPLIAGVNDVLNIARSIASSLDVSRPNARQLENLGRRVLTLSNSISHRAADLARLARQLEHAEMAADLTRLYDVANSLLPFAKELILHHESLAVAPPAPAVTPPSVAARPAAAPAAPAAVEHCDAALLIVDDNEGNRDLLARRLTRAGYSSITLAKDGRDALEMVRQRDFDLVLLDVMMPEIDGIGVLREMKQDARLRDVPVVMISAVDDVASVAQCIELGAEDYLPKPFDQVVLQARIRGSIERKRMRDEEKRRTDELEQALLEISKARQASEDLLRNILPSVVAEELQEKKSVEPMYFEDVTIIFTDFVGFTRSTENLAAEELVNILHDYFTAMDRITERYGLEKLKTIGDSYMCAGGLPVRNPAHPVDAMLAVFDILELVDQMRQSGRGADWSIRIGVHTGPVIAGVVGVRKFAFDIWGESVNVASRMESSGVPNRINVSERTYSRIKDFFACEHRGKVRTKDGHELDMYTPVGVQPKLLADGGDPPPAFARRYRTYFRRELSQFPRSLVPGH
jgi:class 3 adenylate cyclase/CheY-like chemotaxis protein